MGRFVFRLQPVFDMKQHGEKEQKDKFSRAAAILNELVRQQQQLIQEYRDLSFKYIGSVRDGISPQQAIWYNNYFSELRRRLEENKKQTDIQCAKVEAERAELSRCIRERKTIAALRDKQFKIYLADEARAAEKQIDELVAARLFLK